MKRSRVCCDGECFQKPGPGTCPAFDETIEPWHLPHMGNCANDAQTSDQAPTARVHPRSRREAFPEHYAPRPAVDAAYRAPGLKAWLSRLLRSL